jgi:hypothetical protein
MTPAGAGNQRPGIDGFDEVLVGQQVGFPGAGGRPAHVHTADGAVRADDHGGSGSCRRIAVVADPDAGHVSDVVVLSGAFHLLTSRGRAGPAVIGECGNILSAD